MHACLNAVSTGTPAIAIAYSRKFKPLFDEIGWPHVLQLGDPEQTARVVLETADDAGLATAVLDAQRRGRQAISAIEADLRSLLWSDLRSRVGEVLKADACTGCGMCSLLDSGLSMTLQNGYLRPTPMGAPDQLDGAERIFDRACPGRRVAVQMLWQRPSSASRLLPRHLGCVGDGRVGATPRLQWRRPHRLPRVAAARAVPPASSLRPRRTAPEPHGAGDHHDAG